MLKELKNYAQTNSIPIICENGLAFLQRLIEKHQVKNVLEIGTAVGYSALAMASFGCKVTTFEKNEKMIELAKKNFRSFDLKKQIHLIAEDALLYNRELGVYDLIFIDGSKAQYQRFFEKYSSNLAQNGIIVCDNLAFHHLNPKLVNRNTRQLMGKIERFKLFLKNNEDFLTTFYECGDGISVSRKCRE